MTNQTAPAQRIRVAVFLILTVAVLVTAVVLLGHSENLFGRKATLHTSFANAGGLISGSEVRLAGVTIGIARNIHFSKTQMQRVDVDLSVRASYLEWIRKDSVASISSKGLLGDSLVEITEGNPDEPAMKDGDTIESTEPASLTQILAGFQSTAKRVDTLVGDVDNSVKLLLTPQVGTDLGSFIHSLAGIAGGVENGHGLAHTLIFEPGLSNETTQAIHNLSQTASDLHQTIAQVNQTVGQVGQVVGQVGQVVAQVQTGNGMIHNLVYTQDKDELIHNLNDASRILKKIAIDTEEGKGTIGGLLRDPTVYEDLTTILGNVKRNVLLKALIRHEIVNDNLTRPGRIEAGPPEVSGGTTSNYKASAVTTEPKP